MGTRAPGSIDVGDAYSRLKDYEAEEENRQIAARTLRLTWQDFRLLSRMITTKSFARLAAEQFDSLYIPGLPFNNNSRMRICQRALRHRIPTVSGWAAVGRD